MSDNVVLSKHFDSLASAIQRCLSVGYVPTAYIPAGHESVIDNVASTVDGGLWYEVEGDIPVLKMHYGDRDYVVNLIVPDEAYLIINLAYDAATNKWSDLCGNTWVMTGDRKHNMAQTFLAEGVKEHGVLIFLNFYGGTNNLQRYVHTGDLTIGGKDFTLNFWFLITNNAGVAARNATFFRMYESSDETFSIFCTPDDTAATTTSGLGVNSHVNFSVKLSGNTYTIATTVPISTHDASHFEMDYVHENNELKIFVDGKLIDTISVNIPRTTFSSQFLGLLGVDPAPEENNDRYSISQLKIYDGRALHSEGFIPSYD